MEGPEGISVSTDMYIPMITERMPIKDETTTIIYGEFTNFLAVAAGIISIAEIN